LWDPSPGQLLQVLSSINLFLIQIVPVMRAQDVTKPHPGTITLPDRSQPLKITGIGTKFTELKPEMNIMLSSNVGAAEIASIEDDTHLTLKKEFRSLRALEVLETPGGTEFKVSPKIDQSWVYEKVFERIEEGGCIGIYPEGGSHDRPDLLPLKGTCFVSLLLTSSWGSCHGFGCTSTRPEYRSQNHSLRHELFPSSQIQISSCHRIWYPSHGSTFSSGAIQ